MKTRSWLSILLIPAFVVGCSENPTAPGADEGDDHLDATQDLTVDLQMSSSHVHTLSELTFTVTVTDHHGEVVTDFDAVQIEQRAAESDTWRSTELGLVGSSYVGTYTFMSSGDYEIRVAGQRPHDTDLVVMHAMGEMLHAVRAHADLANHRLEFESFPGHIHEGDVATLRFWVMEAEEDADGNRAPISGLTEAQIHCVTGTGVEEFHDVSEVEPGVYEADHTFTEAGDFHAGFHLEADGTMHEAEFDLHVAHGH